MIANPNRPTLFLLSGLMCSDYVWEESATGLRDLNVRIFSEYAGARSMSEMADIVLDEAPQRFALAGHSMGGRVALEVLRKAPQRIERLALLDTGVHPVQPGEKDKRFALLRLGQTEGIEALADQWLPPMVHPDRRGDAEFMRPLREMVIAAGISRFEDQITALLTRPDAAEQLASIRCPTLVGVGRQDEWSPPDQHAEISAAIKGSRLVIFEHCGHMSTVEQSSAVTESLLDWTQWPAPARSE